MNEHKSVPNIRFKGFEDNWIKEKLGNIATVEMNKRIYKSQTNEDGEIPFYKIRTFGKKADSFISNKLFNEYKKKYPYPKVGDILISASGTIGNTVIYKGENAYFQDSNIVWLNVNHKIILNSFLYNFYKIVHWKGLEGSTIKRLYNSNILSTSINYPSITEQQKIGDFFAELDKLLDLQQQKIDKLGLLKKALFQNLFPKHDTKIPELRFKGFQNNWEKIKLKNYATWYKGSGLSKKYINAKNIGAPVIHYSDLYKFSEVIKNVKHWSTTNQGKFISNNSILFPSSDVTPNGLARTSALLKNGIKAGGDIIIGTLKTSLSNVFMSYQINRNYKDILRMVSGTTIRHIHAYDLSNLTEYITYYPEQQKIGNLLFKVDQLIELENKKLHNLQQVKKCLLKNMFVE